MTFGSPEAFYLFLLIPGLYLLAGVRYRIARRRIARVVDLELLPALTDGRIRRGSQFLLLLAIALLILALTRPRYGVEQSEVSRVGVDIVVAVDVSTSMLAKDVQPSRLGRAKRKVVDFVRLLQGDRVGLVAFAGEAFLETPLTYDYGAFLSFLQLLNPDLIPIQGTNIESALTTSIQALLNRTGEGVAASTSSPRGKAVILLTDGEEFDGDLSQARELASKNGVRIFIIGVGTEKGAPIPEGDGYLRAPDGSVVLTRLRGDVLKDLAKQTGGLYLESIGGSEDAREIYQGGIRALLQAGEFGEGQGRIYREFFQIPLLGAVIALIVWGRHREE